MVKNCVKLSLKLLNSAMGLGGIATITYGVLMFRVWQPQGEYSSSDHYITTIPWCFHALLGVGIALCAITCLGQGAANTANTYWLSTLQYIIILLLMLILETVIMADAFMNPNSEKELPVNLSDKFDESYYYIWKWVASLIFLIQAICVLLATLRIHGKDLVDSDESEDERDVRPILPVLVPSTARYLRQADPNLV